MKATKIFALCVFAAVAPFCASPIAAQSEEDTKDGLLQDVIEGLAGEEFSRVRIWGHIQQGFTFNADSPDDHQNFGRLFDDRANDYRFNQLALTVEQALDPQPDEYDWGFKVQLLAGTDARFTHALGVLDQVQNDSVQFDFNEFYVNFHTPWLTDGGIDFKLGQFVTLAGYEVIDGSGNPLYSHSYIFNFGIPLKHMGLLMTAHILDNFDVMAGIVTGINTGFDDNNDVPAFHGGFSLRFFDDDLTFFFAAHYGPENDEVFDSVPGVDPNSDGRAIFDMVVTIKPFDWVTLVSDLNYGIDDAGLGLDGQSPEWYGVAQYFIFPVVEWCDIVLRGEYFRDDDGFVVVQFAENDDFIDLQRGRLSGLDVRTVGGGATSYYAATIGANFKPCDYAVITAEVRYDYADGQDPYNDSTEDDSFTAAISLLFKF